MKLIQRNPNEKMSCSEGVFGDKCFLKLKKIYGNEVKEKINGFQKTGIKNTYWNANNEKHIFRNYIPLSFCTHCGENDWRIDILVNEYYVAKQHCLNCGNDLYTSQNRLKEQYINTNI